MRAGIRIFIFAICTAFATASAAQADGLTFADLLARAKAQAAAGHRSTPPGDNMIETIAGMVDMASTATPAQLEELVALLESDKPARLQPQLVPPPLPKTQPAPPAPFDASSAALPPPVNPSSATATPATPPSDSTPPAPPKASIASLPPPMNPSSATATPANPPSGLAPPAPSKASVASLPPPMNPSSATATPANPPSGLAPPAPPKASVASLPSPMTTGSATSLTANPPSGAAGAATPQGLPRQEPAEMAARATALFARGQAAETKGDISGARRLYGSAAEAGNAAAARSLGRLYDPAYLRVTTVGGVDADPALARSWYERAIKMGDPNAGSLLNALSTR